MCLWWLTVSTPDVPNICVLVWSLVLLKVDKTKGFALSSFTHSPPKSKPAWVGVVESGTGPSFLAKEDERWITFPLSIRRYESLFLSTPVGTHHQRADFFCREIFSTTLEKVKYVSTTLEKNNRRCEDHTHSTKIFPTERIMSFLLVFFQSKQKKKKYVATHNDIITVVVTGVLWCWVIHSLRLLWLLLSVQLLKIFFFRFFLFSSSVCRLLIIWLTDDITCCRRPVCCVVTVHN